MPGLFGYIDICSCGVEERFLEDMLKSLQHFDFYSSEYLSRKKIGVGVVSITANIIIKEINGIVVVCSGDIYDVVDDCDRHYLREGKVDGTSLILMFEKYGEHLPEKLNGSFNIFLYDSFNATTYLFNDRFGYRHLYIYQDDNVLLFSPEIKAFLAYQAFDKTLDAQGISDYFVYFYQFADRTFFKNVKLLPPASVMRIKERQVSIKTYWSPVYSTSRNIKNLRDSAIEGYRLFERSVDRCLGDSKNVLIPLSGGLDSRLIMSVATRRNLNITSATFGCRKCLDYQLAKKVSKVLNLTQPELIEINQDWLHQYAEELVHLGECSFGALGVTTQHGMFNAISGEFDASLNGIYGGHISFGSPYFNQGDASTVLSPQERISRIKTGFNGHRFESILSGVVSDDINSMVDDYSDESILQEWKRSESVSGLDIFRQDHVFLYNRIRRGMNNINQNLFFSNDKQPFACYELFDFYLSLSPELTLNHSLYKEIYKENLPELARVPWQQTGINLYDQSFGWVGIKRTVKRYLSWYLTKYSKGKFSILNHDNYDDQDYAYRNNVLLEQWIKDILLSDRCLDRGYFHREGVVNLLDLEKNGRNLFYEIGKMVMFELWAREFLDGEGGGV